MKQEREIRVVQSYQDGFLDEVQSILDGKVKLLIQSHVLSAFEESVYFDGVYSVDVFVRNREDPTVEACLYCDDEEVASLPSRKEIRGEYCFEVEETFMAGVDKLSLVFVIQ